MHCDLDLWPFDLKIYRAHPCLMGSLHVKFHDDRCKGKAVMCRKPKCGRTDGRTDRRTDGRTWWFQYTPPNFVAGGIIMILPENSMQGVAFRHWSLRRHTLWRHWHHSAKSMHGIPFYLVMRPKDSKLRLYKNKKLQLGILWPDYQVELDTMHAFRGMMSMTS